MSALTIVKGLYERRDTLSASERNAKIDDAIKFLSMAKE